MFLFQLSNILLIITSFPSFSLAHVHEVQIGSVAQNAQEGSSPPDFSLLPCLVVCFRKKHRQSFLRLCRRVSAAPRCHWRSDGRETEAQPTIKKILIRLTNYNDLLPFRFFIYSKSPVDSSSTKGANTIAGTLTFRQVWIWHTFLLCHVEASTVLHCQTPFCCPTGVS